MCIDPFPYRPALSFGHEPRLFDACPAHKVGPERIDEVTAGDGSTVGGAKGDTAKLTEVQAQGLNVNQLVGTYPLHDLRCQFSLRSPRPEQCWVSEDFLGFSEPEFGPELNNEKIGEERHQRFDLLRDAEWHLVF